MTTAYRFGPFEFRPAEHQLLEDGRPVALGQRAFALLNALIERRGSLVNKNELLDLAWPGLVVEENNLQVQISSLRKLLGPRAIATVPGRGYRFDAALDGAEPGKTGGPEPPNIATAATPDAAVATTNLPRDAPVLYGRDDDLTALRRLVDTHRLVTIVGAGGIGKSVLAQAVAHSHIGRWPDGVWIVELVGLSDPVLLPGAVAQTLDIKLTGQDSSQDELVMALATRRMLLLLDNCEHLLDAVAVLAQDLLRGAPDVALLLTSQEPLRLPAEQQYRVIPLSVPAVADAEDARAFGAVALFEARVRAMAPRFTLTAENSALAIDICRQLDGLPLAIELAAARAATLGLRPVHEKLDERFRLLTAGSRANLRRHQTLRAALDWSYGLLIDGEQAVFRRLGVFAGGFTAQMAQTVAGDAQLDEWEVLSHLSALIEKSLVVADPGDDPRYRLLESARAFALERLAVGETAETLRRHAQAVRSFVESIDEPHLDGEMRTNRLRALLLPERDNIRAAHAWATGGNHDLETAIMLAACVNSLEDFAFESVEWLVPLRPHVADPTVSPAVAARFWRAMASGNTSMTGRLTRAEQAQAAERARSLYAALGQPRRVFTSLTYLAVHHMLQGQATAAQQAADEARSLVQPDWPAMLRVRLLRLDGHLARESGRLAEARGLYEDAVRASIATDDWLLEKIARENLADLLWQIGPREEAAHVACGLISELRDRPLTVLDMAGTFSLAMGVLSELDRVDEAKQMAREGLPIIHRARSYCVEHWAYLFWRLGKLETAARLLGVSAAQLTRAGVPFLPNERRLVDEARGALEMTLGQQTLASCLAAGAALGETEWQALIAEALAAASPGRAG